MTRMLWARRGAAVATAVLAVLSVASAIAIVGDLVAVNEAKAASKVASPDIVLGSRSLATLKPAVRAVGGRADVAIGEFLNGALGPTGLVLLRTDTVSVRPLANGLRLAEVRVEGRGGFAVAGAVTNWVAVNREAVRLKSLNATTGPDGEGRIALVLLVVIA